MIVLSKRKGTDLSEKRRSEKSGRTAEECTGADINQLRKVRREKLADLQARGEDPFLITKYDVTHHSQEIKDHFEELENKKCP